MLGEFDIQGVNVLDMLSVALFLGAGALVLARGRGAAWALRAAAGLGLLALARLGGILALQWLLWSRGVGIVEKSRVYSYVQAGLWVVSTVGLALLVVAVLSQRRVPAASGTDSSYSAVQAG